MDNSGSVATAQSSTVFDEVRRVVDEVLQLQGKTADFTENTPLLGSIPELDSMAVVTLVTSLEERFGIVVDDDEISAETFETMGSLTAFVDQKLE